mmetsp:Transcript_49630/g.139707  ORF Transcript_49630/g.139707 Transcript_49630/m.139707 type:complete len:211 (+) Transcript_49630:86-718(+)
MAASTSALLLASVVLSASLPSAGAVRYSVPYRATGHIVDAAEDLLGELDDNRDRKIDQAELTWAARSRGDPQVHDHLRRRFDADLDGDGRLDGVEVEEFVDLLGPPPSQDIGFPDQRDSRDEIIGDMFRALDVDWNGKTARTEMLTAILSEVEHNPEIVDLAGEMFDRADADKDTESFGRVPGGRGVHRPLPRQRPAPGRRRIGGVARGG